MAQFYFEPEREKDIHALPDAEVFYMSAAKIEDYDWFDEDGEVRPEGWYYWACLPGCLPDSDPVGPFDTEQEAIDDAQDTYS